MNLERLARKKTDPTATGMGKAGVLPTIEDIDRAFAPLDSAMQQRMRYDYEHGREKGQTTNNKYLDPYFKWMPGYTNVITGWPGHGKSQLYFELLLTRAVYDGKKSVLWPAENLPAQRFYEELIHTLTGRPVDRSVARCLSWDEIKRASEWIRDRIIVVDPPTGMPYTPAHLLAYFERAIAQHGGADKEEGIAHSMIDPFNKCDNTAMMKLGGPDAYAQHVLGLFTKWSQDTRQCLVVTAHPKRGEETMGYGKTRPVPTGGMISGGQMWENAPHYVGAMHRPFDWVEGSLDAVYYTHKCKNERDVAKRGSVGALGPDGDPVKVPVKWDPITNRYRWGHERYSPLDDEEFRSIWEVPTPALPAAVAAASQDFPREAPTDFRPGLVPADLSPGFDEIPADRDLRTGARNITSNSLR